MDAYTLRGIESMHISSSISNFRDGLKRKFSFLDFRWFSRSPTVFFGMYTWGDYFRFGTHRGRRIVFWCGSDILNIRPFWEFEYATHLCENLVEQKALKERGIYASIFPLLFDKVTVEVSYKPVFRPNVYLCAHKGREEEYGLPEYLKCAKRVQGVLFHIYGVEGESKGNVMYHGQVLHEQFVKEIQGFQAAVRLNSFDGFSEVLARSILMGQYPISRINYPQMDFAPTTDSLVYFIGQLKYKREPNYLGRSYWKEQL